MGKGMNNENKNLKYIKCPKCGWHGAVLNTETGLVTCQYCMYRSEKHYREWEIVIPFSHLFE